MSHLLLRDLRDEVLKKMKFFQKPRISGLRRSYSESFREQAGVAVGVGVGVGVGVNVAVAVGVNVAVAVGVNVAVGGRG